MYYYTTAVELVYVRNFENTGAPTTPSMKTLGIN